MGHRSLVSQHIIHLHIRMVYLFNKSYSLLFNIQILIMHIFRFHIRQVSFLDIFLILININLQMIYKFNQDI